MYTPFFFILLTFPITIRAFVLDPDLEYQAMNAPLGESMTQMAEQMDHHHEDHAKNPKMVGMTVEMPKVKESEKVHRRSKRVLGNPPIEHREEIFQNAIAQWKNFAGIQQPADDVAKRDSARVLKDDGNLGMKDRVFRSRYWEAPSLLGPWEHAILDNLMDSKFHYGKCVQLLEMVEYFAEQNGNDTKVGFVKKLWRTVENWFSGHSNKLEQHLAEAHRQCQLASTRFNQAIRFRNNYRLTRFDQLINRAMEEMDGDEWRHGQAIEAMLGKLKVKENEIDYNNIGGNQ